MSNRITVRLDGRPVYDIVLEPSFDKLLQELDRLELKSRRICVVTDSHVAPLYLKEVKELAAACCRSISEFVFPAGEAHKNLDTVRSLYGFLIEEGFDRQDLLIALGGGVTGDLCGFAAATYLRGIRFVQIPTTLLSQVDSSIGGKTGVDFDAYKNMVGAFHMPSLVYTNTSTLLTLPSEQFSSGMGEVIKHGLIKDGEYYGWLSDRREEILARNPAACEEMIGISNQIKRKVVEEDPRETGERALLNFGHTLGHAIEKLGDFTMLHGHCVGIGCLAAAQICERRGLLSPGEVDGLRALLSFYEIPTSLSGPDSGAVIETTKRDKKMDSGVIRFILLKRIGEAYVDRTVTEEEMAYALSRVVE